MQLTLLITSPRVAPGLLSWPAWQAVAAADRRLASRADHPLARAVAAAGHPVEPVADMTLPALLDAARSGDVVWLADDAEAETLPTSLATLLVEGGADAASEAPAVEVLHGSYDVPGARLLDLVTVMDQLRRHCPWDREQTHRSLASYLVEESYEVLEAIESGDPVHLREELGDLLLQVYFHARIASEADEADGGFTIDDVAAGIVDKLVHRHPHVFADLDVADADEVAVNWEALKASEKGRASVLEGVPLALPALALAEKLVGRAARAGVAPAAPSPSAAPGPPSASNAADAADEPDPADRGGLGDRLMALVVEARAVGLDPEQELRDAVRRLADDVRAAEAGTP